MNIDGAKITATKPAKEVYLFLTELSNFRQLMPESTQKFEVDGDSFLFALKGMPEIRLVLNEKVEFSKIVLGAASSKLSFSLTAHIDAVSNTSSEVQLKFQGDFNPMMAMMVKKPLTAFIDTLTSNMTKTFG